MKNIDLLIEQYKKCKGLYDVDIDSTSFLNEFFAWGSNIKNIGMHYFRAFLTTSGVNSFSQRNAEIGKCGMDSIYLGHDAISLISPYLYDGYNYNNKIFVSALKIIDGKPYIFNKDGNKKFIGYDYDRLTTYNPYSTDDMSDWIRMYEEGINFTIGVYGKQNDKDRDEKIESIKKYKKEMEKISSYFITFEDTRDDLYSFGISTDNNSTLKRKLNL